jgi:hypothetical protein
MEIDISAVATMILGTLLITGIVGLIKNNSEINVLKNRVKSLENDISVIKEVHEEVQKMSIKLAVIETKIK